ncbi:MAG: acetyl-CoA carboxylase biotin carboxyl carrier protein subunit [Candidatus Binatia bacterium]
MSSTQLRAGDRVFTLDLVERKPTLTVTIDGAVWRIDVQSTENGELILKLGDREVRAWRSVQGGEVYVKLGARTFHFSYLDPIDRAKEAGSDGNELRAPMPGVVVSVHAQPGDAVRKGQTLITIESMKLQTAITSPRDAEVSTIHFAEGQTFDRNAVLVTLAPPPAAES